MSCLLHVFTEGYGQERSVVIGNHSNQLRAYKTCDEDIIEDNIQSFQTCSTNKEHQNNTKLIR